jgi:glycosyltransferase involved in cell wall biosynthesis
MESFLEQHKRARRSLLCLADAFIVLSLDSCRALERWGVQRPIFLETTVVPDSWIIDVDVATKLARRRGKRPCIILFLSEVLSEKGVYVAIEATRILQMKGHNVQLIIAGDGHDLASAQAYVRRSVMQDVTFCGYVSGHRKRRLFQQSDIFCLPTMLNEGLPIAVLEAMCFGLPVVTRAAGGLKDLFAKTMFGCITESKDATVIAEQLERLIRDDELYAKVAWNNYTYCKNNCLASGGSERLRRIYDFISIQRRYGCS